MTEPSERPEEYGVPVPEVPHGLPSTVPVEQVYMLLDRLVGMPTDLERVQAIREELHALRVLVRALGGWRSYYCTRMWLANLPTHVIAKAAGVADTYVSKRAKKYGLPPRPRGRPRTGGR